MTRHLGPYRLEEAIGVGSFATVHRAVDERLDDVVAIKVLAENHSMSPEIRERFIAEGRALRRIGGEHCAVVHDMGESERQQPYLVMEHADRGTLQARVDDLRRGGWRATRDDLLIFARSLAAGVQDVHRARLVHRDLSPGNLLLTSRHPSGIDDDAGSPRASGVLIRADERLLLTDLGMCKDMALNSGLTVAGGTSGFRPPEQDSPGVVDIRADIWAMSALLDWLARDADLPSRAAKELRAVLSRGMSKSPSARPADAVVWLRGVEQALAPVENAAQPTPTPTVAPVGERAARRSRTGRWAVVAATALALVCGLLAGWWVGADTPPAAAGGASVAITGPAEVTVGQEAVFVADVEGAESWAWLLPTGRFVVDAQQVSVTATSTGTGEVTLRSLAPDGSELLVVHRFRVVEK